MTFKQSKAELIGRRAELIAELFFQDLNPEYVAQPVPHVGYDLLVGFANSRGGINNYIVEVKSTERPVSSLFPLQTKIYNRLANSNIPALLLVVDVKQNQVFYGWLRPEDFEGGSDINTVMIPVTAVDDVVKAELRSQLATR